MDSSEKLKVFYYGQAGNLSWDTTTVAINKFIDDNSSYDFMSVEQIGQMTVLHYFVPKPV